MLLALSSRYLRQHNALIPRHCLITKPRRPLCTCVLTHLVPRLAVWQVMYMLGQQTPLLLERAQHSFFIEHVSPSPQTLRLPVPSPLLIARLHCKLSADLHAYGGVQVYPMLLLGLESGVPQLQDQVVKQLGDEKMGQVAHHHTYAAGGWALAKPAVFSWIQLL